MKVLRWIDRNIELYFIASLLFVMVWVLFANIILRYIFNSGLIWANEVAMYAMVLISFGAWPIWVRRRSGLRVDLLPSLLPPKGQKFIMWLDYIIQGAFAALATYGCWQQFLMNKASLSYTPTLEIPMYYIYFILFILTADAALRSVQVTLLGIKDYFMKTDSFARAVKFEEMDMDTKAQVEATAILKKFEEEEANK